MNQLSLAAAAGALAWALAAGPARAQTANLGTWTAAGDVTIDSAAAARLTTAAVGSGETPLSSSSALLFFDLEPALLLDVGTLPGDTFEGSGLQQAFSAVAGATVSFDWRLSTVGLGPLGAFDGRQLDRAFVVIDGGSVSVLGTVAAAPVQGSFTHTFSVGNHALAILVMDVDAADGLSTLAISNFNVSVVPEPTSAVLLLAGLAGLGWRARKQTQR